MKNLIIRTLSGAAYMIVMVCCILFSKYLYFALFSFIIIKMMYEFQRMNLGKEYPLSQIFSYLTGFSIFALFFCHGAFGMDVRYISMAFIPLLAMMICGLFVKDRTHFGKMADLYASILYIAVPMTLANFLVFNDGVYDGKLLLCMFIIVWSSDTGAYIFGMSLGQKYGPRLCPNISPKKSWIGAIGGFVVAMGVSAVLYAVGMLPFSIWHCLALGAIVDVIGVYGDLIESEWKRNCSLKDSGNFLPGHGGLMDRLDSAMLALPAAAIYLICVGLI